MTNCCSDEFLLKRNKQKIKVINTNIREQTVMALKVSQTKVLTSKFKKKKKIEENMFEVMSGFKKHNLTTSRNAKHTLNNTSSYKTLFFLPVDSFLHFRKKDK